MTEEEYHNRISKWEVAKLIAKSWGDRQIGAGEATRLLLFIGFNTKHFDFSTRRIRVEETDFLGREVYIG